MEAPFTVEVPAHTIETTKEMFVWCRENCTVVNGTTSWGSSWWTSNKNTRYHFMYEVDALQFKLRFG